MSYCINPHCAKPVDPANANNPICRNCGSQILLQNRYRVLTKLGQEGLEYKYLVLQTIKFSVKTQCRLVSMGE